MATTRPAVDPAVRDQRCEHCRLPFPKPPIAEVIEGRRHLFCSRMCRDAYTEHYPDASVYHGLELVETGVAGLDAQLPDGIPRNTFALVVSSPGARWEALFAELVWRALQRDEPVIVVAFQEPPIAIVQQLLTLQWNVLPYLEDDQLAIIDCFTYRISSYDRMIDRLTDWNSYLQRATRDATTRLTDLDTMEAVHSHLDSIAERLEMRGQGIVLIDSLYEMGTLTQPVHAHNFVKDVRADLSKGRFVPVFSGSTMTADESQFPHSMAYLFDGLIELSLWREDPPATFRKYVCVPEFRGVTTQSRWLPFEYKSMTGMVLENTTEEVLQ